MLTAAIVTLLSADKNAGNEEAQKKFTEIGRAYEVSSISCRCSGCATNAFMTLQRGFQSTTKCRTRGVHAAHFDSLSRCDHCVHNGLQVLSDTEKRQIYDLEGVEGLERHEKGGNQPASPFDMFFGGGGGGRRKGPDAQVEIEVTLEELYNGGQRQARISRNIICPKCRGTGAKDGQTTKCNACQGRGVRMVQQQMAPGFVVQMQETCPECNGKGQIYKSKCPHCQGKKVVMEEKTLTATIEKGMPSNGEIRFERESEQQPGITPGDVIFKLKVSTRT